VNEFLFSLVGGGVGGAIAAVLAKAWIEARITSSIKHEYDVQLEQFKKSLDKRQKVELVAELFAEWLAVPPGETVPKERRTRLNQLSFAASVWLPEALTREMSKVLQRKPEAKTLFEVLLLARRELGEPDSLRIEDITYWAAELEKRGQPVIQPASH
jgi:hypothetical protein